MKAVAHDLTGRQFGGLLVAVRAPNVGTHAAWWCLCGCGEVTRALGTNLLTGVTRSCGCLSRELSRGRKHLTTHGHAGKWTRTPTYYTWASMKGRCKNPSATGYEKYGGRGVTVCERWESFENFLADMGERPAGTTIDRIDSDGNYEPGNCRWATATEQRTNRRAA